MPAIQKCRTCVQPYRGDRYTGTHVRLSSLDSLFYLTIQTDTVTPLSLCFGLFILSLYTKEKRIVCEIGRYCNSREKRAVIIAKMQRAGQCPPGTSVVVRSRGRTIIYIPLFRKRTPLSAQGDRRHGKPFAQKSRPKTVLEGHSFRPALAFRTAAQRALFSAHCDTH